jgi:hypothetical protein
MKLDRDLRIFVLFVCGLNARHQAVRKRRRSGLKVRVLLCRGDQENHSKE